MFGKSRMSDDQLAKLKQQARASKEDRILAQQANGFGSTRVQRVKAAKELEDRYGKRKAAQLREAECRSAGAKPRGPRGWFS